MSRNENGIWQVTIPTPTEHLKTYRSTKIGKNARQLTTVSNENKGALAIFMQMLCDVGENKSILMIGYSTSKRTGAQSIPHEVFCLILSFNLGIRGKSVEEYMQQVATDALVLKSQQTNLKKSILLFPSCVLSIDHVVECVLHGDEAMLINMLKTNPDLTQIGSAIDFSGRRFTGTVLQAAIATQDFAPNKQHIGLFELIIEKLKIQHPERWEQIAHDQILKLYKMSLHFYVKKQIAKITKLQIEKSESFTINENALIDAKLCLQTYLNALKSNDLGTIIHAHSSQNPKTADAQKDHVIEINQELVTAMADATDLEIQAIYENPYIDSPLNNLLKQFRADFTRISHEEIIFNPHHLLKIFAIYDEFHERVKQSNQNYFKTDFFWDHLIEFLMCHLPSNMAQVIANPGLCETIEKGAKNARCFDFRYVKGCIFPPIVSDRDSLDLKLPRIRPIWLSCGWPADHWHYFSKLVSQKNSVLLELIGQLKQECNCSRVTL